MPEQISLMLETTYMELLRLHGIRPLPEHLGSLMKVTRGSSEGWVVRRRAGDRVRETWICADHQKNADYIARLQKDLDHLARWKRKTSSVCAMLRTAGCLAPDKMSGRILAALAETDFFYESGVVAWNAAFLYYPLLLGYKPPVDLPAGQTERLVLYSTGRQDIVPVLEARGFEIENCPDSPENGMSRWRVNDKIDLEIHQAGHNGSGPRSDHEREILEFSCLDPFVAIALHRQGVNIRVPSPERYAICRLIMSQVRDAKFQEEKNNDIAQAEWIMTIMLEKDFILLYEVWNNMLEHEKEWKNLACAGLAEIPEIQSLFFEKMKTPHDLLYPVWKSVQDNA